MKKLFAVTAVLSALVPFLTAEQVNAEQMPYVYTVTIENCTFNYIVQENSTVLITSAEVTGHNVEIPSSAGGFTVTAIGDKAFQNQSELVFLSIPDTVTSIGKNAFFGCTGLEETNIPDSVKTIGEGCFISCTKLKNISVGNSLEYIPDKCFYSCASLQTAEIPPSVKSIGSEAFFVTDIKSMFIPDTVSSIGENAIGMHHIRNAESGIQSIGAVDGFVIIASPDSCGAEYARNYGITLDSATGDVNGDGSVNSIDASLVMANYSISSVGNKPFLTSLQSFRGDTNNDGAVNSIDASLIMAEYSRNSTKQYY